MIKENIVILKFQENNYPVARSSLLIKYLRSSFYGNQKGSGRHIHYLVDHRFRRSHPRESAGVGRPSRRRPGVNSASLKVIYLWFMEERARYGSRKFLGFSATRRKELSAGHNGQAVISFTRRIPRPSVLYEDKKNVGRLLRLWTRKKYRGCCELGGFLGQRGWKRKRRRRDDEVEFSWR